MAIKESGENYLETILMLQQRHGNVRAIDIAEQLGYKKSSVSRAMGILKEKGYITVDEKDNYITLTPQGLKLTEQLYKRHRVLTDFFTSIGVDGLVAEADACRIEHVISEETFNAIQKLKCTLK